jgi:hypothetical protein
MDAAAGERRFPPSDMRLRRLKPSIRIVAVVAILGLLALAVWPWRRTRISAPGPEQAASRDLPHHVTVEVLNSGGKVGAARVGMLLLRHARLDVVYFGNADSSLAGRERNQVLVRRRDTTGVGRVIEALGSAEVIDAPDSARLVDLTILLGKEFVPGSGTPP